MANKHATLTDLFTAIAGAIRSKTGETGAIVADNFPSAIDAIPEGVSGIGYGYVTLTEATTSFSVSHKLGVTPTKALLTPLNVDAESAGGKTITPFRYYQNVQFVDGHSDVGVIGYGNNYISTFTGRPESTMGNYMTWNSTTLTFVVEVYNYRFPAGTYLWIAVV